MFRDVRAMWRYFLSTHKHRKIVRQECRACGIPWQGWLHDLSKFSPAEFRASAIRYHGDPDDAALAAYHTAWLHHKGRNPHHWEYWVDFDKNGQAVPAKIPFNFVVEMICDWIGAGKVYSAEKWTPAEPFEYYQKVRPGRHFHPETEQLVVRILILIRDKGLDAFHDACRGSDAVLEKRYTGRD